MYTTRHALLTFMLLPVLLAAGCRQPPGEESGQTGMNGEAMSGENM